MYLQCTRGVTPSATADSYECSLFACKMTKEVNASQGKGKRGLVSRLTFILYEPLYAFSS